MKNRTKKHRTKTRSGIDKDLASQLYDPPKTWFNAMVKGIKKASDVRDPGLIVKNIWKKLSPKKRAQIVIQSKKGGTFAYDLPLPEDHSTRGTGTVRVVKPFDLAEVQVNVSRKDYDDLNRSGEFDVMKRQDGTLALVKRCKSPAGNCNIFVDKVG